MRAAGCAAFTVVMGVAAALQPVSRRGWLCDPKTQARVLWTTLPTQDWDRPDYAPPGDRTDGNGEWKDWLGEEAFIGEDADFTVDDEESTEIHKSQTIDQDQVAEGGNGGDISDWRPGGGDWRPGSGGIDKNGGGWDNLLKGSDAGSGVIGRSASENWKGWSEEPPFFEDEAEERETFRSLGSSDLWSRSSVSNIELSDSSASSSFTSSATSSSGVAVKEAGVEPKRREYDLMEIKLDNLAREVSNLKSVVALIVGLTIGIQLGGEKSFF